MVNLTKNTVTEKESSLEELLFQSSNLLTPAFIYNENVINRKLDALIDLKKRNLNFKILFPLKTFAVINILKSILQKLDGFSTSSSFETKLARVLLGENGQIHFTSPGLRPDEFNNISRQCNYISFNSLSQFNRYSDQGHKNISYGLRINPQLSFVTDDRYNPCREFSKLGVPINQLENQNGLLSKNIEGILVHNNAESRNFKDLHDTVSHIINKLPDFITQLKWVNLGGGYLLDNEIDFNPLIEIISLLNQEYNQTVFLEPGQGVVSESGFIVSRVVDIFKNNGKEIAVLDTTVNHMPEVFEYQWKPAVLNDAGSEQWNYILAGSTCLAGDVFGEYCLNHPLEVGSMIIFKAMGAYTLVKAHMFNGINLPSVYSYNCDRKLILQKKYTYEDFYVKSGGGQYVTL